MKKLPLLLALILLLTGCNGLPEPREMGDMALLRTMGVDRGVDGLNLTVSTGPRAKGLQGEGQPALVLSAQAPTLSEGAVSIQGLSDSYVFFGYVDQLLFGQGLAGESILDTLDWFARDVELSLNAQLWVIRDSTAQAAVESGGGQGVEARLATLRTDGKLGIAAIPRTAGEVYADLLEQGASYAPALRLSEGENATLTEGGYALFHVEHLVGFLEGDGAEGLELLAGKPSAHVLTGTVGEETVVVRVYRAVTTSRFRESGQLSLNCRVWARLAEYERHLTEEELEELNGQIRAQAETRVRSALDQMRGWQTDCLGLGAKAGLLSPGRWAELEENWPRTFREQEPDLTVRVELIR